ncbi:serine/threonine-protein kinase [Actinomadura sp. NPDC047616]|uniref:serine/threonine protein kinase n=1 Tax=Actinomadura sp. NPDC047616 TaxID=3155914 RepID=UPI00340AE481
MEVGALRSGDPKRLGSYDLLGRVGEGGQGSVFLGESPDGRQVAIKLLHAELTSDDKARARFLREVEVAKRVAPFCTAQVIDADADGDRPYIVSEYVRGPSLNQHVTQKGPLSGAALDRLAVSTATALAAIHQAEVVHRDFKPHNVLIGPDGPRVIDFGVARAISGSTTLTSKVIGTPSYMAPEMLKGEDVGTPADVFCWGATLTFAATGEPPFGQDTIPAVINRILHEEPDLGRLTGPLRDLVAECLDKDPANRPNARQVLMRLLGHEDRGAGTAVLPRPSEATEVDDPSVPDRHDEETAILAAGSVLAAELGDDDTGDPDTAPGDGPTDGAGDRDAASERTQAIGAVAAAKAGDDDERLPTPAEWAAQNTLPPDGVPTPPGRLAVLRDRRRLAALTGAAAAIIAIVITSAVLAFGGNDKTGKTVGDRNQGPTPASVMPSAPDDGRPTNTPTPEDTSSDEEPSSTPTGSGTPTGDMSTEPSGTPSTTPTTDAPTSEPPDQSTDKPNPPDTEEPGTGDPGTGEPGTGDPETPPGPGTGETGGNSGTGGDS